MLLIAGVDPGATGAIGVYDFEGDKLVAVFPLPNYKVLIGRTEKTRLDEEAVYNLFHTLKLMGVRLVGIENVQGANFRGQKQSATGAFQFGYTFGVLRMAARAHGLDVTAASPAVWKMTEQVPDTAKGIVAKADAEFPPEFKVHWHGPKGGALHDMAEAAFLARYFARKIWPAQDRKAGLDTMQAGIAKKVQGVAPKALPKAKRKPKTKK